MKNLLKISLPVIVLALGMGEAFGQLAWMKDPRNPVLSGGASGVWNYFMAGPCVLFNTDSSRYEMWFIGFTGAPGVNGDYHPYKIGFAYSGDGITWTVNPSPVLVPTPSTWDAYTVDAPMVIRQNGGYKMWYTSFLSPTSPDFLGYATSPDGIHWTKYSGNPVFGPGQAAWEVAGPYGCSVMPFEGGYKMWYAGVDVTFLKDNIGYATSADGIAWLKDTANNPVLKIGATGQWDDAFVGVPQVLGVNNRYYMWYTGYRSPTGPRAVGVATSNDTGRTWTKHTGNPVLVPSGGDGWDGTWIEGGSVLQRGDTLHIWYGGDVSPISSNPWCIGHATSPVTGIAEREGEVPQHFMLLQNFPNPFNPSTTIKFELPGASDVRLVVSDMLGREVSVLVNGRKEAGVHEIKFDGSALASGVYFYRLQAGSFVQTKKLVILR